MARMTGRRLGEGGEDGWQVLGRATLRPFSIPHPHRPSSPPELHRPQPVHSPSSLSSHSSLSVHLTLARPSSITVHNHPRSARIHAPFSLSHLYPHLQPALAPPFWPSPHPTRAPLPSRPHLLLPRPTPCRHPYSPCRTQTILAPSRPRPPRAHTHTHCENAGSTKATQTTLK